MILDFDILCVVAGRTGKRPRERLSGEELQEAAIQLLNSHQNLSDLLLEVGVCQGEREAA